MQNWCVVCVVCMWCVCVCVCVCTGQVASLSYVHVDFTLSILLSNNACPTHLNNCRLSILSSSLLDYTHTHTHTQAHTGTPHNGSMAHPRSNHNLPQQVVCLVRSVFAGSQSGLSAWYKPSCHQWLLTSSKV